jgi:ribose 1,5-bisphosphokinase
MSLDADVRESQAVAARDRGVLVLVVGPSGAGKDSLMRAARVRLTGDDRFAFIRRTVTRPSDPASEDVDSVSEREFAAREVEGRFALAWQAHGLRYGLPRAAVENPLERGCCVVANVSRMIVDEARMRYPRVAVVLVTASPATLARRLAARGRETIEDIERRIARADAALGGPVDATIRNDGAMADAVEHFHAMIVAFADARPSGSRPTPRRLSSD